MSWLNPNPSNFKSEQPDEDDIDLIDLEEDDENVEISDKEAENTEGNMFNCDMCNQNYRNKSDFMNHFEVVHQIAKPRINNDELCDVKPKKNRKRRHQEPTENKENEDHNVESPPKKSPKKQKVQCKVCECYFSKYGLKNHQKWFRGKSCKTSLIYKQKLHEKAQIEGDTIDMSDMKSCEVCSKVFSSRQCLMIHMKNYHQAWYQDFQDKKAKIKTEVPFVEDNYTKDYDASNTLICKLCNKNTVDIRYMKNHLMKEHKIVISKNVKKQKCHVCDLYFSNYSKLSVHVDETHKVDNQYKCDKCDKNFESKNDWYHHIYTIHSAHMKKWFDATEFPCSECDSVFDTLQKMYRHKIKVHKEEDPIDCQRCGKVCKSKTALKSHMRMVHHVYVINDEKKVKKCDQCETEFQNASEFDEHLRSLHECDKDFKCKDCDLTWVSHLSLELHYIESHQKIMFSCDICGYTSIGASIVRNHRSTHERKDNFECDDCGEFFHKKSLLIDHLGEVHNDGEWRFSCDYCGKRFMNKSAVNIHVEDNHAKDPLHL